MTQKITRTLLRNKKILLWGLSLTAGMFVFLGGSFVSLAHNKLEKRKLTQRSKQLDVKYEQLTKLKTQLEQEDPVLIEKIARTEYHLVKPGEIEYRFNRK